ncbi:hypothetical protein V3Q77_00275 [Flavobacterium davisii]|uniref:Uncharacterized protein n=1 Tax=Flavobacterium davisii TaxID=2906077 RepID=A0A246GJV4_9FLAO|nr:hypothetical protein [Flavobacterium davisii]OWP84579.1 hypothetical protein BWK59_04515 [Flavobacterium davisii]
MNQKFQIYKIKPNSIQLTQLANKLNLVPEALRWFHNLYCPLEDLIESEIQSHVVNIYIPISGVPIDFYAQKQKSKPFYNKINTLYVPPMFNKKYGIIQRITTNDEEISTIHYQIKLQKTALDTIIIDRHPVYINYRRPELMLEQIVDEIGRIFYPLELELYDNAKLKVIANFSDIQKRWKAKKILLENYYKGKVIENLFKKINDRLQYRGQTQRGILDSWFFVLYFFSLYETFNDQKTYTFNLSLPIWPKKPKVLYEITLQIEETISETNKFRIYAKGHSIATEMQKDNTIHSTEFTEEKGNLEFVYTLNAQDNSIFSICGKVDLKHHNTIRQINFECYEQY